LTKKEKIVILTGAGALLPWKDNGLSILTTNELTDVLRNDDRFVTSCSEPIGEFLYRMLTNIMQPEHVNFEQIIDLLDNLWLFLNQEDLMTILSANSQNTLLKQEWIKNGYIDQHGKICPEASIPLKIKGLDLRTFFLSAYTPGLYDLRQGISDKLFNTPKYEEVEKVHGLGNEAFAKKRYIQDILYHFVNLIIEKVKLYALQDSSKINLQLNGQWNGFLQSLKGQFPKIRIYTLNYDRFPVNISTCLKFFDGFNESGAPDLNKLWQDADPLSYINLHGSVHWGYDKNKKDWHCDRAQVFDCPPNVFKIEDNNNRANYMIRLNIITGLQKSFRILENPFYDFYQKFVSDCLNADTIITIGYSYGDEHVNKALGMTRRALIDVMKDTDSHNNTVIINSVTAKRVGLIADRILNVKMNKSQNVTNGYVTQENNQFNLTVCFQGLEKFLAGRQWEQILK